MSGNAAPLKLVLDTNVWLDWLVFDDDTLKSLKHAQASGAVEIFVDKACGRELEVVLGYDLGKHTLDAAAQAGSLAESKRIARPHPGARTRYWRSQPLAGSAPLHSLPLRIASRTPCRECLPPFHGGRDQATGKSGDLLPKCRDTDDQKFLELARDCGADYLITKDKALLVLARRKTRPPPCRIVTPQAFCEILDKRSNG